MNRIARITAFVEQHKNAFAVSRLIMLSGVQVRRFEAETAEDDASTERVMEAARGMLTPEEYAGLQQQLAHGA